MAVAAVVAFGADERARGAGADEGPFLYGSVLMANASSLLLPGANLTNLLVLASEPVSGATFVARVLPAALVSVLAALARRDVGRAAVVEAVGPVALFGLFSVSVLVNNLPAAVLLSASPPPHPRALLFGLSLIGAPLAIVAMAAALLTGTR